MATTAPLTKLRESLVTVLNSDVPLTSLLTDGTITYRPRREAEIAVPSVTFFDFGVRPDNMVPLLDRTIQFDVWAETLETAEEIAHRLRQVLDLKPFDVGGDEARPVFLRLLTDRDMFEEDGDVAHKVLEFRLLAYDQVA